LVLEVSVKSGIGAALQLLHADLIYYWMHGQPLMLICLIGNHHL